MGKRSPAKQITLVSPCRKNHMGYSENISNSTFKLTLLLSQIVVKTECMCYYCVHPSFQTVNN